MVLSPGNDFIPISGDLYNPNEMEMPSPLANQNPQELLATVVLLLLMAFHGVASIASNPHFTGLSCFVS